MSQENLHNLKRNLKGKKNPTSYDHNVDSRKIYDVIINQVVVV